MTPSRLSRTFPATAAGLLAAALAGCGGAPVGDAEAVARARGLSPEHLAQAAATFVPPGQHDEYFLFSSGGHSGQVHVVGIPSMRLLKTIAVFTPEPWQGFGYGASWSMAALGANPHDVDIRWGDSHHPALSETAGNYDGRWLYINDRAHGRIGMVDLTDFRTKQVWQVPNLQTSHGGVFVTQDTEYAVIASKVPALKAWDPAVGGSVTVEDHLERYAEIYRGYVTFCRIDEQTGRILPEESFQVEVPPYNQDLADAGKGPSHGWAFLNSYNVEMATGGTAYGRPSIEVGASRLDFDFLHVVNWKQAEQTIAAGRYEVLNGIRVIRLETAVEDGILYFAPEPRSPHGVDVAPCGNYITVSGKLDPHVTVYGFDRILQAIEKKDFESHDSFGVPVLRFDSVVAGQVEVGAGPLHTQYGDDGHAYTSLFLESAVAKWSLGPPYHEGDRAWKLVDKISVHYNIGHLATTHGDTKNPDGRYLVALNKWSIDRHPNVGPLHPQNFQLIDISGEKMRLLADMPIGFGEPHYAQIVRADVLKPKRVYPLGTSARTGQRSPNAIASAAEARVEHREGVTEVWMAVVRSTFHPDIIPARLGDQVIIHLTSVEQTPDATHGFSIPGTNVMVSLDPGETTTVRFDADVPGSFSFYCTEFCSALHLEMQGWLLVQDAGR